MGTSGWLYEWNEGASLDWYVEESGLNAIELNASFYRFPFKNQVRSWAIKGKRLKWSVKVHRSITHMSKLGEKSINIWQKFTGTFKEMDNLIDFYLFQLPPNYVCNDRNLQKVEEFSRKSTLGLRMAVEFRHASCFNQEVARWAEENSIVVVSVDSPIATWITPVRGIIYLRMHGRGTWYGYEYSREEIEDTARRIAGHSPNKVYVFFNNDHWMLNNARCMKSALEALV